MPNIKLKALKSFLLQESKFSHLKNTFFSGKHNKLMSSFELIF